MLGGGLVVMHWSTTGNRYLESGCLPSWLSQWHTFVRIGLGTESSPCVQTPGKIKIKAQGLLSSKYVFFDTFFLWAFIEPYL